MLPTVAASIVGALLEYCNSLLYGTSQRNLGRLQRVQNSLALPYYSVSAADTLPYAVTLTFDLEHSQFACDVMKLCTNLKAIDQSAAELLRFQYLT